MTTSPVYSSTTASNPKSSWFLVPSEQLDKTRFGIKLCEVLLSLVAFILEELVSACINCSALYFFEFVSCGAFVFTLLLVVLLATPLHTWLEVTCWHNLDFVYSTSTAFLCFISSIILAVENSSSALEQSAMAFGFVVSAVFLTDIIVFLRTHGVPFKQDTKEEVCNGVAATQTPPPETKPLTAVDNASQ